MTEYSCLRIIGSIETGNPTKSEGYRREQKMMFGRKRHRESADLESRRELRRQKRKRERRRHILLFLAAVFTVILIFFLGNKVREQIQERRLLKARNESFVGAPPFEVDLLEPNEYSRPGTPLKKIKGIVVHYTANPGTTAKNNRDYFQGLKDSHATKVSSHFVVGIEGEIVQCIPSTEIAYASNSRNEDTLSIECCHLDETGAFTDATYISLVRLTGWLCYRFNLTSEDVIRHYDVTGKNCPKYYVENPGKWEKFKKDVEKQIREVEKEAEKAENP